MSKVSKDTARTRSESLTGSERANLVSRELADLESYRVDNDRKTSCCTTWESSLETLQQYLRTAKRHPHVWIFTLLSIVILCGISLPLIVYLASNQNDTEEELAADLAIETGRWFCKYKVIRTDQLDRVILPLFSLAQFVGEIPEFYGLADRIGPVGEIGSRPLLPGSGSPPSPGTHRNVSGVCDDPVVVERYNRVAKTLKENAKMEGVMISLQLVPYQVVCNAYPLNNTEDFEEGVFFDSTGAIGLDLLSDPARIAFSEGVIKSEDVYIAGPLTLRQCANGGECLPAVEKAFIASLPVRSDNHTISFDGVEYNLWGSVESIINWQALIDRSDIFTRFQEQGKGFRLTRNDVVVNLETNEETITEVRLAETDDFESDKYDHTVSIELDTVDDMWEITIAYESAAASWVGWAIVAAIVMSLGVSLLIFAILVQKQKFRQMKTRYLEDVSQPQKLRMRMFVDDQAKSRDLTPQMETKLLNHKPIADFYPATSVFYADIKGFSSFASEREPRHVFKLLQTVFLHFDKIARKRKVFKVDTLGDKYMAATGLPDAQPDHAERLVRFAQECQLAFFRLTRELEKELGPATGALEIRMGIASGPVTAGVLFGATSKFHLFGPTVKRASQLNETSEVNRIQFCQKTADLLVAAGRKKWVEPRRDALSGSRAQGYYLTCRKRASDADKQESDVSYCSNLSVGSVGTDNGLWDEDDEQALVIGDAEGSDKENRLIEWQVQSLLRLLVPIVGFRDGKKDDIDEDLTTVYHRKTVVLDEVQAIISLPEFNKSKAKRARTRQTSITIPDVVEEQLRSLIREISSLYHKNPFHNFEHACHVVMASHKLLERVSTPEEVNYENKNLSKVANDLHAYTFGITSDPITHFAVVFSALIHDIDHRGVGNGQLAKENPELAERYRNQSVAEQNSVDLGWDLLMQPKYKELQQCIFCNRVEFLRFRHLVVNCVLATDIFDPELKAVRNMRWEM
ncbi:MAG: hypothetical protein SGBAC_007225 [Bacillariaceae sp.]